MSVWKKIESKVLESGVNMELLAKALKDELNVTMDFNTKKIRNTWGSETVDCALYNERDRKTTALGFRFSKENGVELVGDIYGSGLGSDGNQEKLMNTIAKFYQKHNIINKLESNGWVVEDVNVTENDGILIDAYQW